MDGAAVRRAKGLGLISSRITSRPRALALLTRMLRSVLTLIRTSLSKPERECLRLSGRRE
jgi:hypothetical protein